MISLIVPFVFFFILVLFYPLACFVLSLSVWLIKRQEKKRNIKEAIVGQVIDGKIDELKQLLFIISIFLIFFFVTPFAVFYIIGLFS